MDASPRSSPPHPVRFGPFEADLSTGELRKHGVPLRLQDQPAKILAALLEHPGEIVTRDDLVKLLWPGGTFVDFDRGLNAAINRLRQALSDSAEQPRYVETVARRGYRFIAAIDSPAVVSPPPPPPAPRRPQRFWIAAAAALLALAGGTWLFRSNRHAPLPPTGNPIPLTSYEGVELSPSFSPDGAQVVFSWNGPQRNNYDLYVKTVGSDPPMRLTSDPASDQFASWSPDGRWIAFHRLGQGVFLVPPTGGPERKLVAFDGVEGEISRPPDRQIDSNSGNVIEGQISWSSDGQHIAYARNATQTEAAGIFLIAVNGSVPRRLTTAEPGVLHLAPAFSPDGRRLAFSSCRGFFVCSLFSLTIEPGLNPGRIVQGVAPKSGTLMAISWTPEGKSLLVNSRTVDDGFRLWRVPAAGEGEPQLLNLNGLDIAFPAIASTGRLAYARFLATADIWNLRKGAILRNAMSSTYPDREPQLSPDGNKVAFSSTRSGASEIWVANADGSQVVQLTFAKSAGTPRWSPDGRQIAYDIQSANGDWDIQVVSAADGHPTPLVVHPATDVAPSFSHDGKWVYFSSNRQGEAKIFRVPAGGGEPERVTHGRGVISFEAPDGKSIYYVRANSGCATPLFAQSLPGGPERKILDSVCARGFVVTGRGIYYQNVNVADRHITINLWNPDTGKSSIVDRSAARPPYAGEGLTVSDDGMTILLVASAQTGSDLYLVENFR